MVVLGDLHMPFHDKKRLKEVIRRIKEAQPDVVAQVGDLYDLYSLSRYAKSQNLVKPEDELFGAKRDAEKMWSEIQAAAPKAKCLQLLGNHDARLWKKLYQQLPELADSMIRDYVLPQYRFKGVVTTKSPRDHHDLRLNGERIRLHHGFLSRSGDHMRKWLCNTVVGHSHRPGIQYELINNKPVFEANAGYLGDSKSSVFSYNESSVKNWVRGYLEIDANGPKFISLE